MECEWLMLADSAQAVNNKLYLLGGGWDMLVSTQGFPFSRPFSIVAAFSVPWNETNQQQHIEIEIADEDGGPIAKLEGDVEVGRPPGMPIGRTQRVQVTLDAALQFAKHGTYVITARVAGEESRRTAFYVMAAPRPR